MPRRGPAPTPPSGGRTLLIWHDRLLLRRETVVGGPGGPPPAPWVIFSGGFVMLDAVAYLVICASLALLSIHVIAGFAGGL